MEKVLERNSYFADYNDIMIVEDNHRNYTLPLFEFNQSNNDKAQTHILKSLDSKYNILSAQKFQNLVHFQDAINTPIQRWFPYREGYSTRLVDIFIKELSIKGNILDPFSGSGTTLLSARKNNLQSYGIEINPISAFVSNCENSVYSNDSIELFKNKIEEFIKLERDCVTYSTSFELAEKVFNFEILQSLLQIKNWIKNIDDEQVRNLFFLSWLSKIEKVSNIKKEGNGIKYKHRKRTPNGYIDIPKDEWESANFPPNKHQFVVETILQNLRNIQFDLQNNYGEITRKPVIFNGDCLKLDDYLNEDVELTFYSPPYCNCFDYFEIHKVELWLGEFVKSKEELRELRLTGFRSNTNSLKSKPIIYQNENLEKLINLFDIQKLWDKNIINVVRGYFDDTKTLLEKIYQKTQKGGYTGIVVGNSAYTGVIIPSDLIIAEIAEEVGFKVKNIFVTRHLTTSSQQKQQLEPLKEYLRESIVFLQK